MQLHETMTGKKFFESQLPKLIKELGRIADALEERNRLDKEKQEQAKETDKTEC